MNNQPVGFSGLELLVAYSRNPSVRSRNQIVQINAGLVRKVAYQLSRQCSEPYEDLEQLGYLGLIRAIERFNPYHGYAFSSFAMPYIKGEILHYLRDKSATLKVPRRWQELYSKGKKIRKQLTNSLGYDPKDSEVAKALGVSLQEWNDCQLAFQNRLTISLDVMVNQFTDYSVSFAETLADTSCQSQQKIEEEQSQLQSAINQLDQKSKEAIECVFLRQLSRKEAAVKIGISPMTVSRHLKKGIKDLESILQSQIA